MKKFYLLSFVLIVLFLVSALFGYQRLKQADTRLAEFRVRCESESNEATMQACWQDYLLEVINVEGIDKGFQAIQSINKGELKDCHGLAHDLGEAAYSKYLQGGTFTVNEDSLFCDFGFWHGFMGVLTKDNKKDYTKVKKFCDEFPKRLDLNPTSFESSCYHGVGIGSMEDPPDPKYWGNAQAMIQEGEILCEAISTNGAQLSSCMTGVFHAIVEFMAYGKHQLSLDRKQPFALCQQQASHYQKDCYMQIAPKLPLIFDNNVMPVIGLLQHVDEKTVQDVVYIYMAAIIQNIEDKNMYSTYADQCRRLGGNLQTHCIRGLAKGLMDNGSPGAEFKEAITMCENMFTDTTKAEVCYQEVLALAQNKYSVEKYQSVCHHVNEKSRIQYNCG